MLILHAKVSTLFSLTQTKLVICSNFWANYSIFLQKSPHLKILPVLDKIITIFPKVINLEVETLPILPGLTHMIG